MSVEPKKMVIQWYESGIIICENGVAKPEKNTQIPQLG